ncbi:FAD binding domain-containing protein, partial [Streptomyces echinatus]
MPLWRVRLDRRGGGPRGRRRKAHATSSLPAHRPPSGREGGGGMREFGYRRATDVAGAVALLGADPDARFLGGGTNLVDLMKAGVERPARLVDIRGLPLDRIESTPEG